MKNKRNVIVSVIIPTHNRSSLLVRTISSIQKQTIQNIEILVCDDGSTDDTQEIVSNLSDRDSRIRYIFCGANGRPAIPRNIGIKEAKGEWIAFCDDDDLWLPAKLESQLYMMKKHNVKASCTNAWRFTYDNGVTMQYFQNSKLKLYGFSDFLLVNPVICSSSIIHSSLIKHCYGFAEEESLKALEDYAFWLRIALYTKFLYIHEPLVMYLDTSSSSIRKEKNLAFEEQQKIVFDDFFRWRKNQSMIVKVFYLFSKIVFSITKFFDFFYLIFRRVLSLVYTIFCFLYKKIRRR